MTSNASNARRAQKPDLHKLLRKIINSFILALLGSWCLLVSRLNVFHTLPARFSPEIWFWVDLTALSIAIFGVLSVLWYNSLLSPRLKRLSGLGESRW